MSYARRSDKPCDRSESKRLFTVRSRQGLNADDPLLFFLPALLHTYAGRFLARDEPRPYAELPRILPTLGFSH
jgi:hypothetical protein